jgi:YHS domain-containing protein
VQIPRLTLFVLLVLLLTILARPVLAFEETNTSYFGGVALDGYDAVSYFTESKAVKGNKAYTAEWKGATWRFSSETNRRRFTASPEAFAPQYGGYCSNQMSLGNLSDVDIEVWRIIDNKLYLFGHDAGRVRWASETGQRILDADQHWKSYLGR